MRNVDILMLSATRGILMAGYSDEQTVYVATHKNGEYAQLKYEGNHITPAFLTEQACADAIARTTDDPDMLSITETTLMVFCVSMIMIHRHRSVYLIKDSDSDEDKLEMTKLDMGYVIDKLDEEGIIDGAIGEYLEDTSELTQTQ